MKNSVCISAILILLAFSAAWAPRALAQSDGGGVSEPVRDKYLAQIRKYKHDCIIRELDLTKEQQREFFPLYDEMEDQIAKLNYETREIVRKTIDNPGATDAELEAAAAAVYSQRLKEGQIDMAYYDKFSKILNNKQILRLKNTERKFTQRLMKHHRDARKVATDAEDAPKRQK